jgi:hypothetical protein
MFGIPVNSSAQLRLGYFSPLLALALVHLAASGSCFLARALYLAIRCASPDATLLKHIAMLEQSTAQGYVYSWQQEVAATSQG